MYLDWDLIASYLPCLSKSMFELGRPTYFAFETTFKYVLKKKHLASKIIKLIFFVFIPDWFDALL